MHSWKLLRTYLFMIYLHALVEAPGTGAPLACPPPSWLQVKVEASGLRDLYRRACSVAESAGDLDTRQLMGQFMQVGAEPPCASSVPHLLPPCTSLVPHPPTPCAPPVPMPEPAPPPCVGRLHERYHCTSHGPHIIHILPLYE